MLLNTIPTEWFVALSAVLFSLGVTGVLLRRNAIMIFMSIELMFNSANLVFIAYARQFVDISGQVFVFFIMVVAAVEVAIGLALIVTIFRLKHTIDVDELRQLKG